MDKKFDNNFQNEIIKKQDFNQSPKELLIVTGATILLTIYKLLRSTKKKLVSKIYDYITTKITEV